MKVVLEIKNEVDLTFLLPLLKRLRIPFNVPNPGTIEKRANGKPKATFKTDEGATALKNFDLSRLEKLFNELHAMKAFAQIEDPIAWQRQLRDEWN